MACRFPGSSSNQRAFLAMMLSGTDCISPEDGQHGAFLAGELVFNLSVFGIPSKQASLLDTQQR
jgi:acyl transferase domain-containing protein